MKSYFANSVQMAMEQTWGDLKKGAKNGPAGPGAGPTLQPAPFKLQPLQDAGEPRLNPKDMVTDPTNLAAQFSQMIDLSLLPDYAAVKKYFGAVALHISGNDQCVIAELLLTKPPAE